MTDKMKKEYDLFLKNKKESVTGGPIDKNKVFKFILMGQRIQIMKEEYFMLK